MSVSILNLPVQYVRQQAKPIDIDSVFATTAARSSYLTSPRRYPGQLAYDLEADGVYALNAAGSAWNAVIASGIANASNGLSLTNPTTVQLGQAVGAVGDPGKLTANVDIPLNSFTLNVIQGSGGSKNTISFQSGKVLVESAAATRVITIDGTAAAISLSNTVETTAAFKLGNASVTPIAILGYNADQLTLGNSVDTIGYLNDVTKKNIKFGDTSVATSAGIFFDINVVNSWSSGSNTIVISQIDSSSTSTGGTNTIAVFKIIPSFTISGGTTSVVGVDYSPSLSGSLASHIAFRNSIGTNFFNVTGGNTVVGSSSDNGSKLQVTGNVSVSGSMTFAGLGVGTTSPTATADITVDTIIIRPTDSQGLVLRNSIAGTSGSPVQNSPLLRFRGSTWNTADSVAYTTDWIMYSESIESTETLKQNSNFHILNKGQDGNYYPALHFESDNGFSDIRAFFPSTVEVSNTLAVLGFLSLGTSGFSQSPTAPVYLANASENTPTALRIANFLDSGNITEYIEFGWMEVTNVFTIRAGNSGVGSLIRPIAFTSNIGFGDATTPTAKIHIVAGGTTAAGDGQLKFSVDSALKTTPEDGLWEYNGGTLYFTVGSTRKTVTLV